MSTGSREKLSSGHRPSHKRRASPVRVGRVPVVKKALVCRIAKLANTSRVASRSVGRAVGAIPRSVHEPTKRPKHPGCPAAVALRGDAAQRTVLVVAGEVYLGFSPGTPGPRRQRVLEHTHRGGEHGTLRKHAAARRSVTLRPRALHSAVLGPCCSEPQGSGLLPSTEAGAIERTVLAA